MKNLLAFFSFIIIHLSFSSAAAQSMAVQDLQRAILMTDATMEHSFTGSPNNMRMYDLYNTETKQGSGTADVWPYTAALEAHCSVLEALEALKEEAPQLYADNHDRFVTRLKQLFNSLDYYRGTYTLNSYARISSWSIYGVHRGNSKGTAAVTGIENVYDDQMWICRELTRAYKLTADEDYLKKAEYLANYCIDGWDCCLDADGNDYGGISWGDTHFMVLDCGEDKADDHREYAGFNDFTQLRAEETDFIKRELKSPAFRKAKRRILLSHIPVFGNDDKYQPCRDAWASLLKDQPFSVAISAHTHKFNYSPKGLEGATYPVLVGDGPNIKGATVTILQKKGNALHLKTLSKNPNNCIEVDL